nr:hypothetical protein [uncultured Hyphomonas sp.]
MFTRKLSADDFVDALEQLVSASEKATPAALHNGAKRILERSKGFAGNDLDGLINYIVNPPRSKQKKPSKGRGSTSARNTIGKEQVAEIVENLKKLERDKADFDRAVDRYNKACTADTLKVIASQYAASSKPKTKAAAVELLKTERGNKVRIAKKHGISGSSRPW